MPNRFALFFLGLAAAGSGLAADHRDLGKIERTILREPAYVASRPLYGLLIIGASGKMRTWLVLDKSKADGDTYDVLYADLNGNGDLTESGERFAAREQGNGGAAFQLPDWKDPATGATHTNFSVKLHTVPKAYVMVSLMWQNRLRMGGGYPEDPDPGYMQLADRPADAPILWANGDGPFRFQRWYGGKLTIGAADDLKVFIGQQGVGRSSFWAFTQHVLPQEEAVQATLLYTDATGTQQVVCQLKDRC
jgi:hypothetical protein